MFLKVNQLFKSEIVIMYHIIRYVEVKYMTKVSKRLVKEKCKPLM